MRKILKIALALGVCYLATVGGLFALMWRPLLFGKVMAHVPGPLMMVVPFKPLWFVARGGKLKAGDPAPDFRLYTADNKGFVQLSSFRGHKPVVLVFGSYT